MAAVQQAKIKQKYAKKFKKNVFLKENKMN